MHANIRTLLTALSFALGLASAGCGGPGVPPVCSACTYKTAAFVIDPLQLQGGTITSASMHTEVSHSICPYGGTGPCTATLDMDVTCKTSTTGAVSIAARPNGFARRSSSIAANVNLVVVLPSGGGTLTLQVPTELTNSGATAPVSPCGGSVDPNVEY